MTATLLTNRKLYIVAELIARRHVNTQVQQNTVDTSLIDHNQRDKARGSRQKRPGEEN